MEFTHSQTGINMGNKTPLFDCHLHENAKMVDFAGWEMPLHYGSQIQEHHQVRQDAGMFDVSHMSIVDLHGKDTAQYLRYILANNVDRLVPFKALYTCLLNEAGGIIDDLIVYRLQGDFFRIVSNSGTHDKVIAWLKKQASGFDLELSERPDLAMLAIQGPRVNEKMHALFAPEDLKSISELKPFTVFINDEFFVARTGYTGEEGFEIIMPAAIAPTLWQKAVEAGIKPCGLGARDTLRLEAGLNLYGIDMDEKVTPLESNLTWTVAFTPEDRNFIGRAALEQQQQSGAKNKLVGLVLEGNGVLRNHQKVLVEGVGEGEITSGSFSPTLNKGIALARVPATIGTQCLVEMRGKHVTAQVIKPPFVKQGKKTFSNMMERENE
jgi:aminomethyltransferase